MEIRFPKKVPKLVNVNLSTLVEVQFIFLLVLDDYMNKGHTFDSGDKTPKCSQQFLAPGTYDSIFCSASAFAI